MRPGVGGAMPAVWAAILASLSETGEWNRANSASPSQRGTAGAFLFLFTFFSFEKKRIKRNFYAKLRFAYDIFVKHGSNSISHSQAKRSFAPKVLFDTFSFKKKYVDP